MSGMTRRSAARVPRNSVRDRPGRLKLLLRRQRRLVRPAAWGVLALACVGAATPLVHPGMLGSPRASTIAGIREQLGKVSALLGLRVTDIVIEGRANTPEPLLRSALGVNKGEPILGFSVADARTRIETLSWVEHATVERRLPGTIVVALRERRPFAVWQHQGKFVLIDRAGSVVADQEVAQFRDLPLLVGPGAPAAAAVLLDALRDRPAIASRVIAAVRMGERRWNLRLNTGTDILLPEGADVVALDRLASLHQQHALLDRPLQVIDLRLPDRLVVRPQPNPDSNATGAATSGPKRPT